MHKYYTYYVFEYRSYYESSYNFPDILEIGWKTAVTNNTTYKNKYRRHFHTILLSGTRKWDSQNL